MKRKKDSLRFLAYFGQVQANPVNNIRTFLLFSHTNAHPLICPRAHLPSSLPFLPSYLPTYTLLTTQHLPRPLTRQSSPHLPPLPPSLPTYTNPHLLPASLLYIPIYETQHSFPHHSHPHPIPTNPRVPAKHKNLTPPYFTRRRVFHPSLF